MDTYNSLSKETLRVLEAQNWEEVSTKLHVAIVKSFGIDLNDDVLPGGIQAHDLASDAILSLYSGARHWDYVREPNVAKFLFNSIVRSNFNHLLEAPSTKLVSRVRSKNSSEHEADEEVVSSPILTHSYSIEEQAFANDIIAKVKAALHADKTARDVFDLRLDGCTDKLVAYFLNLTVGQVRAANRRILQVGKRLFPNHIRI
jgi:DNA-directed RNA polymerase specialized sigma24 family protein